MRPRTTVAGRWNRAKGFSKIAAQSTVHGGFDGPLTSPMRQTTSIGRRSVTLVHTTKKGTRPAPQTEVNKLSKKGKPRQLFWAKRLEGLRAMVVRPGQSVDQAAPEPFAFGGRIIPVGPEVKEDAAIASLAALLHRPTSRMPITGQTASRKAIDSNAGVFTNPDQPLMQAIFVTNEEIALQEGRVGDARRRLEEAMKHFG